MIMNKLIFFKENATTSWDVARSRPQEMERAAQRLTASIGYMGASICFSFWKKQHPSSCLSVVFEITRVTFPSGVWWQVTRRSGIGRYDHTVGIGRGWAVELCGTVWNCTGPAGAAVFEKVHQLWWFRDDLRFAFGLGSKWLPRKWDDPHTHKSLVSWRSMVLNLEGSVHETKLVMSTSSSKILNKCVCAYKMYNSYWTFAWWTHFLVLLMHF